MPEWRRHVSLVGWGAGIVAGVTGAIVGVAAALPLIEPMWYANRGYVREQVGTVQATVNDILIWRAEDTKNKARSEQADWNIKLQKENDPQTRAMIQERVEHLGEEQRQSDDRIRALRGR